MQSCVGWLEGSADKGLGFCQVSNGIALADIFSTILMYQNIRRKVVWSFTKTYTVCEEPDPCD